MKVVGCTHAGTSAVKAILNENPEAEVQVMRETIMFLSYRAVSLYT